MSRKEIITTEVLISLIDKFYAEKCSDNPENLKIPMIGEYVRSNGYKVGDYLIRRNVKAREHIQKLKNNTEEFHLQTVAVYRDIDLDTFLAKNNIKSKLKTAIQEREHYYLEVTNSAAYAFKENERLKKQVMDLQNQLKDFKEKYDLLKEQIADLKSNAKKYQRECKKLKEIVETYVYPEIANEFLKESGLLQDTAEIVDPEVMEKMTLKVEDDISPIKNNVVKGLFEIVK